MTKKSKTVLKGWKLENTYGELPSTLYHDQTLNLVRKPELLILNEALAAELELNIQELKSENGLAIFAGNAIPEGGRPLAQAYAGHQFGHFTMLGDGRALLLGEQVTSKGEHFDIQLKGSGQTAYSRSGDGRAAIGPMLREYIISEAMHALGIPTTRSLAVVATGESVFRESILSGAVLTRVASSHIRVGTFQYIASRGTDIELKALADYTIARHYPSLLDRKERYLDFLKATIQKQASLIAKWQLVGFIHGVMNTDNIAISGETIDYGPCAFMNNYDPTTVFSSIDTAGRYSYGNQPNIALWGLARFAESLLPLLHENQEQAIKLAQDALSTFDHLFKRIWNIGMGAKLGIFDVEEKDELLFDRLLQLMEDHKSDYTNTFRSLTIGNPESNSLFQDEQFIEWTNLWKKRLNEQSQALMESTKLMKASNPAIIPRNHLVEAALEAIRTNKDFRVMNHLLEALANPFDYTRDLTGFIEPPLPSAKPYQTYCGT